MYDTLRIKNWQEFQHYKNRGPFWIKLHFRILASSDWVTSTDSERVLIVACMLIASQSKFKDGRFEANPQYFQRVAYLEKEPDFKSLIDKGFLESLDLSIRSLENLPLEKRREETEKEKPGPQKPRPVISSFSDFVKTKSMTPQQVYSTVGKLSNEAMRMIGNGLRGADLKESLKTWAARNGVEYDADIVLRALDVADGKSKTASGAK